MPCWYYEKQELRNSPSKSDGISFESEMRYRKEGARFIIDTGSKMDLGYNTTATGVVYFHRFYMFHSFRQFPRYVTACCCLFLAGKVEETPKKCKDIIKTAKSLLTDQKFSTFGDDPKEEVMTLERILLQTIKFDLQVEHPYNYLLKYAKCLKGDKTKLQKMVQMAWTFVNDSLCTTLALQWEPEVIAVALMYLAGKLSKFEVVDWIGRTPKHLRWWDMFVEDITMELLEDICHQVLDLYQSAQVPAPDSPPLLQKPEAPKSASNGQEKTSSSEPPPAKKPETSNTTIVNPQQPIESLPFAMYRTFTFQPTVANSVPPPPGLLPPPAHLNPPPRHLNPTLAHLPPPPPSHLNLLPPHLNPPPPHLNPPQPHLNPPPPLPAHLNPPPQHLNPLTNHPNPPPTHHNTPPNHLSGPPILRIYPNFQPPPHFPVIPPMNASGFYPPPGPPPPPHHPAYFN